MNIAVIAEQKSKNPILPYGDGGLARVTHMRATSLHRLGHSVTLFAPEGSRFAGLVTHNEPSNMSRFDAILDCTHLHEFSQQFPRHPVVNLLFDTRCLYQPPNAVVESHYMIAKYPSARLVRAGIMTGSIPFDPSGGNYGGNYLAYIGGFHAHKQGILAEAVARRTRIRLDVISTFDSDEQEDDKWRRIGGALALLCPYTIDASPRTALEAAACGTPVLCLAGDGTKDHVLHGKTGFVCHDIDDMVARVSQIRELRRTDIRSWVVERHDEKIACRRTEELLRLVRDGFTW